MGYSSRSALSDTFQRTGSARLGTPVVGPHPERGPRTWSAPFRLYAHARRYRDELRQDHRSLGIISNSDNETRLTQVLAQAGILDYFGEIVSSGTEGVEKPHPEIFLRAVRRRAVKPDEAMYVCNRADTDTKAAQAPASTASG